MSNKLRWFEVISTYKDKEINLPKRKTKYSAGYDFESAEDVTIPSFWRMMIQNIGKFLSGEENFLNIKPNLIKTGIKAYFQEGEVLKLYNRSSNPFKKGLVLANSVGIIDGDYVDNETNEGHIQFAFYNFFPFDVDIKKGDAIGQGIFTTFLKVNDDISETQRDGGFGSTDDAK